MIVQLWGQLVPIMPTAKAAKEKKIIPCTIYNIYIYIRSGKAFIVIQNRIYCSLHWHT